MTADQLRKSILQQAIQGKLVPQDPNDEPASVLLERIREEKARLVEEKKIKKEKNPSIIFRGEDNSYYEKFTLSGEVKCIDEEIPFEIPNGWEWCRLEDISVFLSRGKSPKYSEKKKYPVFAQKCNLKSGRISLDNAKFLDESTLPKWGDEYKLKDNDILVNSTGTGTVGRVGMFSKEILGDYPFIVPDSHISVVRLSSKMNSYYIYEVMNSMIIQQYIEDNLAGSTNQKELYIGILQKSLIPLPSLAEQQRIVEKIEELIPYIEHYGKAQAELNTLNKNIKEQLKKSILQYAIEGKLVPQDEAEGTAEELLLQIQAEKLKLYEEGKLKKKDLEYSTIFKDEDNKYYEKNGKECIDITNDIFLDLPISWRWCRLKDIVSIFTGATFKKEEVGVENIDIRILRGGNIQPFKLTNRVDDIFLPKDKVKESILLKKNDIVTPAVTSLENIGKMARVEFDLESTTVGGFVFILRQFYCNDILSKYLLALLSSPVLIDYIKSVTNKSGQAFYNISKNRLEMTLLPLPPLAEQQRIVESIDAIFRCIEN